jgi:DNA polymerase-3 subunit delta
LYYLIADDPFLLNEALSAVKAKVLEGGASEFNYDSFYASEDKASKVRDTVETLPMMSRQRLVIFREAHLLKDKDWEDLFPLLDHPVESACLVLVADKVDKRKKAFKKLSEKCVVVELQRPYENQLSMWIEYIGAKHGLKLSADAQALIRQFIGTNLSEIFNELGKLKDFLGERTSVEAEDVLKVVSRSRVNSVFDLANAIGRGDRASALVNLAQLLESGQNEVGALALIARHFRILTVLRESSKLGLSGQKLSGKAGVPHFFLQEYMGQLRSWPDSKLEKTLLALRETDRALKSSPLSSHIWLENFVLKTCGGSSREIAL